MSPPGGLMPLAALYTRVPAHADITMSLDFGDATQFGDNFGVNSLSQDGFHHGPPDRRQR